MMTQDELVAAVVEWVVDVCPAVEGNTYAYTAASKVHGLPDVMVDVAWAGIVRDDPDFPLGDLQQAALAITRLTLNFMVAVPDVEADHEAATSTLRGFYDALLASVLADHTLGGRVQMASPFIEADYDPQFVDYSGTVGRQSVVQLAVAEMLRSDD